MESLTTARRARALIVGTSTAALALAGHAAGGGHIDPVMAILITAGLCLAGHRLASRERGAAAIAAFVIAAQAGVHVVFSVGHVHAGSGGMVAGHAAAAVALAAFLRFGERRVHDLARRQYLRWLIAMRGAAVRLALPVRLRVRAVPTWTPSCWSEAGLSGRGPPAWLSAAF